MGTPSKKCFVKMRKFLKNCTCEHFGHFLSNPISAIMWTSKPWILSQNKNSNFQRARYIKKQMRIRACPQNGGCNDSCHQNGIFTYFSSKTSILEIFFSQKSQTFENLIFCQNLKFWKSGSKISNLKNLSKSQIWNPKIKFDFFLKKL